MSVPKRKLNMKLYPDRVGLDRRQEMLEEITKSDAYLPDPILHDDLDLGMLNFIQQHLHMTSDGVEIPIIPRILTMQRWGEISNTWTFVDDDRNIKLPFIAVVRKPDVQPGTNPALQRTIPDRRLVFYSTVKRWDGTQMKADLYKIPQPIAVDISYEVVIVCHKFRDLNRFNKLMLQHFSSRQAYTKVKGHYIPLILERNSDNSPIDTIDGRRFYQQTYEILLLGFLIDADEFEVQPAISRLLMLTEFDETKKPAKRYLHRSIEIVCADFVADGQTTSFSVGETIGMLFHVTVNGLTQRREVDYFHISTTSRISFQTPPIEGSTVSICYHPGRNNVIYDSFDNPLSMEKEYFTYDGSSLVFTTKHKIDSVLHLEINGLIEMEETGYVRSDDYEVTLLKEPIVGSQVGITYFY